jgi:hypothetical protein
MNNPYRQINRQPSTTDRVKLAAVFVAGFGGLGAYQIVRMHRGDAGRGLVVAAAVLAMTTLLPVVGRWVYVAWMGLGVTIGLFTQPAFLFLAYAVLFVPLALLFALIGRDTMKRKPLSQGESYWEDYDESDDLSSYFEQY